MLCCIVLVTIGVEININPVEGLKLDNGICTGVYGVVEININPVEGLKLQYL